MLRFVPSVVLKPVVQLFLPIEVRFAPVVRDVFLPKYPTDRPTHVSGGLNRDQIPLIHFRIIVHPLIFIRVCIFVPLILMGISQDRTD